MKIRTRVLTAVLATATAFSCALTASALNPTPSITVDNNLMAATVKEADGDKTVTATLTLSSKNFEDVTGAKVKLALPEGLTVTEATIVDKNKTLTENVDYKIDGNTVTLVDVFNLDDDTATDLSLNLELKVSGQSLTMGDFDITVSGDFADTNVDQVYTFENAGSGTLTIAKEEKTVTGATNAGNLISSIEAGYFIPYGGVYSVIDSKIKYYDKDDNGHFDLSSVIDETEVSVLKCELPADGEDVTTFGFAKKDADETAEKDYDKQNGLQFGTYAKKETGKSYGTLLIMGDYNAFKTAINAATDDEALRAIVARYDSTVSVNESVDAGDAVTFTKGTNRITVKKVTQTKEMWSNDDYLQYAIRLIGLVNGKTYTAAGYSLEGSTYNFSAEVQSKLNPFLAE